MYAKTRAFSETSGRGLFCYAKRCAKKSKIKKKVLYVEKKKIFFKLDFYTNGATPHLKKSSHLHEFDVKRMKAATTNNKMKNSSHQPH